MWRQPFFKAIRRNEFLWARIPKDACQLIGVPADTLMRLLKPIYGQADAPRRWFQVARRRLIAAGYQLWCSYRVISRYNFSYTKSCEKL